jgi:hypothetical protein
MRNAQAGLPAFHISKGGCGNYRLTGTADWIKGRAILATSLAELLGEIYSHHAPDGYSLSTRAIPELPAFRPDRDTMIFGRVKV